MTTFGRLPYMEADRGASWGQPKGLRDRVRIYATHATISEADWLDLSNYRTSYPSGVYPGKAWRRGPWLMWYGHEKEVTERGRTFKVCVNGHARALVQGPGVNMTGPGRQRHVWLGEKR